MNSRLVEVNITHEVVAIIGVDIAFAMAIAAGRRLPCVGAFSVEDNALRVSELLYGREVVNVVGGVEYISDALAAVAIHVHLVGIGKSPLAQL